MSRTIKYSRASDDPAWRRGNGDINVFSYGSNKRLLMVAPEAFVSSSGNNSFEFVLELVHLCVANKGHLCMSDGTCVSKLSEPPSAGTYYFQPDDAFGDIVFQKGPIGKKRQAPKDTASEGTMSDSRRSSTNQV